MSCEKGSTVPVAIVERSGVTTEPKSIQYFDSIDVNFGGGKPYQAAIEKRIVEIATNPRFSV